MSTRLSVITATLLALVVFAIAMRLPKTPAPSDGFFGSRHIMPLKPQQRAAFARMGVLESAARAARAKGDWAGAAAFYRAETRVRGFPVPEWTWADLGLMLDRQGRRREAFTAYQKGFGVGSGHRALLWGGPEMAEAAARFGAMCEDRGLHADACECYYVSRCAATEGRMRVLDFTLDPKTTSPAQARMLLDINRGIALEREQPGPSGPALAAFKAARSLAPNDPRPQYFLADGLRRAGRFTEAEAALQKASALDTQGRLKAATAQSLKDIQSRSRY